MGAGEGQPVGEGEGKPAGVGEGQLMGASEGQPVGAGEGQHPGIGGPGSTPSAQASRGGGAQDWAQRARLEYQAQLQAQRGVEGSTAAAAAAPATARPHQVGVGGGGGLEGGAHCDACVNGAAGQSWASCPYLCPEGSRGVLGHLLGAGRTARPACIFW